MRLTACSFFYFMKITGLRFSRSLSELDRSRSWIGTPHPVSNLRPQIFAVPENENEEVIEDFSFFVKPFLG